MQPPAARRKGKAIARIGDLATDDIGPWVEEASAQLLVSSIRLDTDKTLGQIRTLNPAEVRKKY